MLCLHFVKDTLALAMLADFGANEMFIKEKAFISLKRLPALHCPCTFPTHNAKTSEYIFVCFLFVFSQTVNETHSVLLK